MKSSCSLLHVLQTKVFMTKPGSRSDWDSIVCLDDSTIEPMDTSLSVYTVDTSNSDFQLRDIADGKERCEQCELLRIASPRENIKCRNCRLPDIIEPISSQSSSKGRASYPKLSIPDLSQKQPVSNFDPTHASGLHPTSESAKHAHHNQRCSACELSAMMDPSGTHVCSSSSPDPAFLSPTSPASSQYSVKRSRAGRNSKLPPNALHRLQAWLDANRHNPYPSADMKQQLAQECGITEKQVTTWFTNARARQLNSLDDYVTESSDDGMSDGELGDNVADIPIGDMGGLTFVPEGRQQGKYGRAASVSGASIFSPTQARQRPCRRGKKKVYRQGNTNAPLPTQTPTLLSPALVSSPLEYYPGQSDHAFSRDMTATADSSLSMNDTTAAGTPSDPEMWQCTFCRKSLVPKSWRRHEETQHRPKAQWTCMLYGPRLSIPARSNSSSICAFCNMKNPPETHFQTHHRIEDCAKRDVTDRTFFRPDHLRQHVKNFHNATLYDVAQARWKRPAETVKEGWTCGFCTERLETWDKRETHIANHFKDGSTMASWQEYGKMEGKSDKKGKRKEKEIVSGFSPLAQPPMRHHKRNSYMMDTSPPLPQHQQQHHHHHQHQVQPPQQSAFSNIFQQIPSPNAFQASISQPPPMIPAMTPIDSLPLDCMNPIDWSRVPNPMPGTTQTQMQYPTMGGYNPTAALQQHFGPEMGMGLDVDVDLYGHPLEYQGGPWDGEQHGQAHQQHHQHPHPHQ
ncbi:hypothetical protein CC80DRAFT_29256 [Byssothecium circinans]|uniref:Homeobox domain-containing protein n=1 Tax=Byssothecium circinans TaxID=147558 RepID=A0A6A5U314_9PLEO|nr:hypothetical protein CC80DRAFT_29256 [Byssothecium circinans]